MNDMQLAGILLGATAVVVGPFVWWVVRQAASGALSNNPFSGIRTHRTMASQEAWLVSHRAALPVTEKIALVSVGGGLVAVALGALGVDAASLAVGFVAAMISVVGAFPAVRAAHRALDDAGL